MRLRVTFGLADALLEEICAGRHDLVIATYRPRGRSLTASPLSDEEFVLVTHCPLPTHLSSATMTFMAVPLTR